MDGLCVAVASRVSPDISARTQAGRDAGDGGRRDAPPLTVRCLDIVTRGSRAAGFRRVLTAVVRSEARQGPARLSAVLRTGDVNN